MPDVDVESLLSPLSDAAPSGADLEYDDAFRRLTEAGEDKPEVEYGDTKYPAQPPNWPVVREEALALPARPRDAQVAGADGQREAARASAVSPATSTDFASCR